MDQSPPATTKSSSSDDSEKFRSSTDTLTEAAVGNLIDLDSDHDDAFKPPDPQHTGEIRIESNDSGVSFSTGRSGR